MLTWDSKHRRFVETSPSKPPTSGTFFVAPSSEPAKTRLEYLKRRARGTSPTTP